jgi:hypothetical protein
VEFKSNKLEYLAEEIPKQGSNQSAARLLLTAYNKMQGEKLFKEGVYNQKESKM